MKVTRNTEQKTLYLHENELIAIAGHHNLDPKEGWRVVSSHAYASRDNTSPEWCGVDITFRRDIDKTEPSAAKPSTELSDEEVEKLYDELVEKEYMERIRAKVASAAEYRTDLLN